MAPAWRLRATYARRSNVIATMRTIRNDLLQVSERLAPWNATSRSPAIVRARELSGPVGILVHNAGIGMFGAVEATPMATVREVFETSTFGVIAWAKRSPRSCESTQKKPSSTRHRVPG